MSEIGVGTVLDNTYEVERLIGQGGMGQVWAARHKRLPKQLAVKVLLGAKEDPEGYARFKREAEIATRIGHPNIVEVLDFNTLPSGTPYLVMELLDGESLARRIKRGPIALDEAMGLVRQIGSALNAAHKSEVVHRDLKPDNIFLCPSDVGGVIGERVKILDFGISKIKNAKTVLTQESTLMGTPQYMSPEQASGKNSLVDQRTDVFALGAIVYEMLSGKAAFAGDTLATVVVKVMLEQPPPLEELNAAIPAKVRQAVSRALEKDPAKRTPDVATFVKELTGAPLQTLDRRPVVTPEVNVGFLPTEAPVPATNQPDAFAKTGVATQGSLARGEVAIPTEPVNKKRTSPLVWVLAGVVLAGGAGAVAFVKLQKPPVTVVESDRPKAPEKPIAVVEKPIDKPPAEPPDKLTQPAEKPAAAVEKLVEKPHHESLPPAVTSELQQAEAALSSGDTREAIRLARHTLLVKASGRAFAVITRAQCRQGDLGGAKASLHSVDRADLARVKRECKAAGIDL